ncbi:MAG: hypothetical protein ACI307_05400 [Sodaliphilus sp.]
MLATHIPRRPKKKPLRGKKVGFAEKKLRLWLKMAHRVYQSLHPSPTAKKNFDKGRSPVKKRHSLKTMKVFVMSGETT